MAEWLVERGVGEDRALLIDGDTVLAAKMRWPDEFHAGQRLRLTLASKAGGARRGTATDAEGRELLVDRLPPTLTEGQAFDGVVIRAAMAERGRHKMAQARPGTDEPIDDVFAGARVVRRFPAGLWEDVWESAASAEVPFPGGALHFSPTPAMSLIDIDGHLPPRELALAAVSPIADALRHFDIGGSVGIDFPTLPDKGDRRAVDEALERALAGWRHERTAMNGFGFVQIVSRLEGPSLLHRLTFSKRGAAARMALRRAEMVDGAGATLLTVHPALESQIKEQWRAEVERRTGRPLRIASDPGLALAGASAQIVPL